MINHVVLFKLKEFENEDQKAVVRNKIKNALLSLKDKIKELKYIEIGQNQAAYFAVGRKEYFQQVGPSGWLGLGLSGGLGRRAC